MSTPAATERVSDATPRNGPVPDVRDMAIVHQFYRREFALAPRILRDLRPQEAERRAAAQQWFAVTLVAMHHHHESEDELMYPLMRGSVPDHLLELMGRQHESVAAGVDVVERLLDRWVAGEEGAGEALASAYDDLLPRLTEHLDDEERQIVPLVAESMTAEQYGRKATSGNGRFEPWLLMMCFGAMIEECSAQDADWMLSHLPEEVSRSWYHHIALEYRDWMALLRGDLAVSIRVRTESDQEKEKGPQVPRSAPLATPR